MKDSFVLYGGQYDAIKDFTLEQKGQLLDALFHYVRGCGLQPTITDKEVSIAFSFFRLQIDNDSQKYAEKCEKNKRIAQEREERRKNERTRTYTNVNERTRTSPIDNDKIMTIDNDNNNDNDNDFFVFLETQKEKNEKSLKWIVDAWNYCVEHFGSDISKVKLLTDERRALLTALLPLGSDKVKQGIINAARSPYLNGRTKERKRPADFDWIMRYDNFVRCVEGSL